MFIFSRGRIRKWRFVGGARKDRRPASARGAARGAARQWGDLRGGWAGGGCWGGLPPGLGGALQSSVGAVSHSFQPSFFPETRCFPRVLGGFLNGGRVPLYSKPRPFLRTSNAIGSKATFATGLRAPSLGVLQCTWGKPSQCR